MKKSSNILFGKNVIYILYISNLSINLFIKILYSNIKTEYIDNFDWNIFEIVIIFESIKKIVFYKSSKKILLGKL